MRDISLLTPVTVTLAAGDWFFVLGLLTARVNEEGSIPDGLLQQILDQTQ